MSRKAHRSTLTPDLQKVYDGMVALGLDKNIAPALEVWRKWRRYRGADGTRLPKEVGEYLDRVADALLAKGADLSPRGCAGALGLHNPKGSRSLAAQIKQHQDDLHIQRLVSEREQAGDKHDVAIVDVAKELHRDRTTIYAALNRVRGT